MALPFILGLAVGAGAIVAFNKSDKLKKIAGGLLNKSKVVANSSLEKGKETVNDVKQTINATAACIKEKKEQAILLEDEKEDTTVEKVKETE
jgi:hypothetical protein